MSFYSSHFTFDGIPCEEYGLMIYDFGPASNSDGSFASAGDIVEDRTDNRYKPFYYGTKQNSPLEFSLTFGAGTHLIDSRSPLDRWDMENIASWLTNKDGYKWLEIQQQDLDSVRYRCIITELKYITVGWSPWAFSCKVTCDSPFAYTFPETFLYNVNGTLEVPFYNRSTYNGFYMPQCKIDLKGGNSLRIVNHSDGGRLLEFSGLPNPSGLTISVDNENCVITNSRNLNLYPYFNFNFFRLIRGDNALEFKGNYGIEITCEFPVNTGG